MDITISNNTRLRKTLRSMYTQAGVAQVRGISDPNLLDEEFWRIQVFTVINRFYALCRFKLNLDLAVELEECTDDECLQLALKAEELIGQGVDYAQVRAWHLHRGKFEHALAYARRHDEELAAKLSLRVLVILAPKGAKWLSFGPTFSDYMLVDKLEDAHHFPVVNLAETTPEFLARFASKFEAVKEILGAKEVKVLCGRNPHVQQ